MALRMRAFPGERGDGKLLAEQRAGGSVRAGKVSSARTQSRTRGGLRRSRGGDGGGSGRRARRPRVGVVVRCTWGMHECEVAMRKEDELGAASDRKQWAGRIMSG
jgi:hypothetical protein